MAAEPDNALNKILNGGGSPKGPSPAPVPDATPDEESDALSVADMNGRYSTVRPANKLLTRMHVVDSTGKIQSFQYHFLDARSTFEKGVFKLLFIGAKHWEVTVKGSGPKFWAIYDYCTLHRWPYLMAATGSMPGAAAADDTVLTEIVVKDVTPKDRE